MYRLTSKLIIYSNIGKDSILYRLADVIRCHDEGKESKEDSARKILDLIHELLDLATTYGFNKNLWHNYLAFLLAMTETPFTLVSEKVGANEGSVNIFAKNDIAVFKELFDYDFSKLEHELEINCFSVIGNFNAVSKSERIYNKSVSEKVQELSTAIENAKDTDSVFTAVTDFYLHYGVGKFGLNKAFRVNDDPEGELIVPITNTAELTLDMLVGYESQKQKLIENTEAFIEGRAANNVLLYGEAGTGKSTSIKAILNMYYGRGLRMIEIYKHQFKDLSKVIASIKNRNYRFIIYMDDLSFEETELEYKYLKAIIEGGLEPKPDNVLIYATSNRRHLVRETFKDRADADNDDIHRNDTVQEKLSLSARFGISIGFFRPTPPEYKKIVLNLAARHPELNMSEEELLAGANKWELSHGGPTGRVANQYIDYLLSVHR
ncbi:MAG: ATP-binding protein [Lachnospiraceae bacterium]|nr:ATP-binding protein [Lachnospiraceae bacterium]